MSAAVRSSLPRAEAARLARAVLRAERVSHAALSITFVGRRRIRGLNRTHLGHDRETDVIALTLTDGAAHRPTPRNSGVRPPPPPATGRPGTGPVVGDVYVCVPVAVAQARGYGASPREELRRLAVHGVLHVLGWDHPDGPARTRSPMWRRQEQLLARARRRR